MTSEPAFEAVMDRLKSAIRAETDSVAASALGISPQAYSNRKKAGSIPYSEIVLLATTRNLDLQHILTGAPAAREVPAAYEAGLDVGLLTDVIVAVDRELTERGLAVSAKKRAQVVAFLYSHFAARGQIEGASFARFMDAVLER